MIRARESMDRWSVKAHEILDRVQRGCNVDPEHVEWSLNYLGDTDGSAKIPRDLMGGHRHAEAA